MAGKIEKRVRALLAAEPDNAFTIEDLCEHAYGRAEKKHRVAILRVVRRIIAAEPRYATWESDRRGREWVLLDRTNVHSYAMARLKSDTNEGYRGKGFMARRPRATSRAEAEAPLRKELQREGNQELIREGGVWWGHVEEARALVSGDTERAATIRAENDAGFKAWAAKTLGGLAGSTESPPAAPAAAASEGEAVRACEVLLRYLERAGLASLTFDDEHGAALLRIERVGNAAKDGEARP
jgi:hypothetical protein